LGPLEEEVVQGKFTFSLNVLTVATFMIVFSRIGGGKLGKRKVINEENLENILFPSTNDVLGMAVKMLGFDRIMVRCQDGKERLCRVRGKLKRRVWIREGDIVLVSPWDFQSDTRGDIFWRYRKNQTELLRLKGFLTM
jgi:translation initiation factor 1A